MAIRLIQEGARSVRFAAPAPLSPLPAFGDAGLRRIFARVSPAGEEPSAGIDPSPRTLGYSLPRSDTPRFPTLTARALALRQTQEYLQIPGRAERPGLPDNVSRFQRESARGPRAASSLLARGGRGDEPSPGYQKLYEVIYGVV
jgi:hypothetical protein